MEDFFDFFEITMQAGFEEGWFFLHFWGCNSKTSETNKLKILRLKQTHKTLKDVTLQDRGKLDFSSDPRWRVTYKNITKDKAETTKTKEKKSSRILGCKAGVGSTRFAQVGRAVATLELVDFDQGHVLRSHDIAIPTTRATRTKRLGAIKQAMDLLLLLLALVIFHLLEFLLFFVFVFVFHLFWEGEEEREKLRDVSGASPSLGSRDSAGRSGIRRSKPV